MNPSSFTARSPVSEVGRDRWARRTFALSRRAAATRVARCGSSGIFILVAFIAAIAFTRLVSPAFAVDLKAPAYNWALPLFTKEGFRTMVAHGSKASATAKDQYEVADLNLTLFSGDAATRVETIILSPAATFRPDTKTAHGEKSVRFIRDEVEASGTRWIYRQAEKKISLDGDVRVTFRAELAGLLK